MRARAGGEVGLLDMRSLYTLAALVKPLLLASLHPMCCLLQADKSRVKDYIHRLDNFDGPAVGEIAVG